MHIHHIAPAVNIELKPEVLCQLSCRKNKEEGAAETRTKNIITVMTVTTIILESDGVLPGNGSFVTLQLNSDF